jgi:hypothetical protein
VLRPQPNRAFISAVGALLALGLSLSCQSKPDKADANAHAPQGSTDSQAADLIAAVKDVSASRLEKGLPVVRFEDWLRVNSGPDWTTTWSFSQNSKNAPNFPDSVDIRGDTKDGRYFRFSIGTTTNANHVLLFWLNGAVNVQHKWVGLEHLSQLPRLLHPATQNSHSSDGQKPLQ